MVTGAYFFRFFSITVMAIFIASGTVFTACGKKVTNITNIYNSGGDGSGGDDDKPEEIDGSFPGGFGAPTIRMKSEHVEMVMKGGESVPMVKTVSDSGAVDIAADITF